MEPQGNVGKKDVHLIYTNVLKWWWFLVIVDTWNCRKHHGFGLLQFNSSPPGQNGGHFAEDIFKCIFVNENVWILIKFSLNIVPDGQINNISALVQIMAWRWLGDKPLSEPMMVLLLMHICVTRPQWVNRDNWSISTEPDINVIVLMIYYKHLISHQIIHEHLF